MAKLSKIYSDIDFTFTKKPVVSDVALSYDSQAVIRSIRNLLLTNHYEKPFHPEIGSNIQKLLFENMDKITASALEREITDVITNYEPRVSIESVKVLPDFDNNAFSVNMTFLIVNMTEPITIQFFLQRER